MANEKQLYLQAQGLVLSSQKASTSWLQRQLRIGYNAASKLIERMEADGLVSAPNHVGSREVLEKTHPSLELLAEALADRGATVGYNDAGRLTIRIPIDGGQERQPSVSDDRLRLLIERVERLEEEKKGIGDDIKDVYNEAKATGYDAKIMREIVRLRKMKPDDRREREAVLESYKAALGID